MQALLEQIVVDETHLDEISLEFNKCANCVEEIITETKNLKYILANNYKGRASTGVNDYFDVLNKHLDLLHLCYKQLVNYTEITKETSLFVDKLLGNLYNNSK